MTAEERHAWDMYFASIVAMTYHPGYTKQGTEPPNIIHCAELAFHMIDIRREHLTHE